MSPHLGRPLPSRLGPDRSSGRGRRGRADVDRSAQRVYFRLENGGPMDQLMTATAATPARRLYEALAGGDRDVLDEVLHPDFVGLLADGMPGAVGGQHVGPAAMRRDGWGAIARDFE